jgi:hypothetical protein
MHTRIQPGLHTHSWSPADDLMKRYVVEKKTPSGWLALFSFHNPLSARGLALFAASQGGTVADYRLWDQEANHVV